MVKFSLTLDSSRSLPHPPLPPCYIRALVFDSFFVWLAVFLDFSTLHVIWTSLFWIRIIILLLLAFPLDFDYPCDLDTVTMALCVNCSIAVRQSLNRMYEYNVLDMSPEMLTIVQDWTGEEAADGDRLCMECFNLIVREFYNRIEGNIGERQFGHQMVCAGGCGLSLARQTGRRARLLTEESAEYFIITNRRQRQLPERIHVCNNCWQSAHNQIVQQQQQGVVVEEIPTGNPQIEENVPVNPQIEENVPVNSQIEENVHVNPQIEEIVVNRRATVDLEGYRRVSDTPSHCFVPECNNAERRRVPKYIRKKILTDYKIYIPYNARVCEHHISVYDFDFLNNYEYTLSFTPDHIVKMLDLLRNQKSSNIINFEEVESTNDQLLKYWTGLTIVQFLMILGYLTHLGNICRKPRTALGLFFVRLRTGEPLRRIASLFCISTFSLCNYIKKARNCLLEQYMPFHLGLSHITREQVSSRNLLIPNGLFGTDANNPIILVDGTYVYMQKSSNYSFQKESYSLHKYANLVKPLLMVASDGYILDIFGPYSAKTSDADIMNSLFQDEQSAPRNFLRQNDILILDRGFRDSLPLLRSLGYSIYKPETLDVGERQLSTLKANQSRMVTMCRWVIEIVNGRFKRDFKIFRSKYFNLASKNLMNDFKIVGAIINNFHPAVTDRPDAQRILNRALQRVNLPNYLAEYVISNNLNRHQAIFNSINAINPQLSMFPIMEMSDLILFSLGTYQIKQARSYYGEHIRADGTFIVEVSNHLNTVRIPGISSSHVTQLLRGRIRSRHQTNKVYYTYILLKINDETDWQDRICGYYCSCIIGKRTMGSCAHVMTIVWYLGWARHRDDVNPPAQFLDDILVREDVEIEDD